MKRFLLLSFAFWLFVSCNHEVRPGQVAEGPKPFDEKAVITGTVVLKEGLVPKGFGTLFVIAREQGEIVGPPLAVRRIEGPVFPVTFQLSQKNVMMSDRSFTGQIMLTAKWSKQGSPMAVSPGDLSTSTSQDVSVGTRDVKIVLDQEL